MATLLCSSRTESNFPSDSRASIRSDTDPGAFPQNPANDVSVVGWPAIQNTTVPNARSAEFLMDHELAAVLELADRTYTSNLAPTLNAVLVPNPSS